jgi:FKBP-type peptidyl-prolyl cis-trans isomerase FkpA
MNLKLILCAVFLTTSTLFACKDKVENCDPVATAAKAEEVAILKNYLSLNSISFTEDSRGFFYRIVTPGEAAKPTICNSVSVKYKGKFTAGGVFDEAGVPVNFELSKLIVGWQEGIPLIGKNGSIVLYLPPSLAYGAAGNGTIPANSNLIFEIDLVDFN